MTSVSERQQKEELNQNPMYLHLQEILHDLDLQQAIEYMSINSTGYQKGNSIPPSIDFPVTPTESKDINLLHGDQRPGYVNSFCGVIAYKTGLYEYSVQGSQEGQSVTSWGYRSEFHLNIMVNETGEVYISDSFTEKAARNSINGPFEFEERRWLRVKDIDEIISHLATEFAKPGNR